MSENSTSTTFEQPEAFQDINFSITSETGILQQVIVHTPGEEMAQVSPEELPDLLFEDILHLEDAHEEHESMCRVFRKIVGRHTAVLQIASLLGETFQFTDAREHFVEGLCALAKSSNLQAFEHELKQLSAYDLKRFAITGRSQLPIHAQPIPNLMFTRDVAAVVGDAIVLSHPATTARTRESLIMRIVMHHHPSFRKQQDRIIHLPKGVTFEGGDLLVVNEKVVLIGNSERTSFGGIINVADALFEKTLFEHVIMVTLPARRSCMHLDTVFTFASPDECVVYPPLIESIPYGGVVRISKTETAGRFNIETCVDLKTVLQESLGHEITFIPCGGNDPLSQQREQWTDGANFFALAPGLVIGYERNQHTFEEMGRRGYRVVTADGFLSYYEESDYTPSEKMAIKLEGNELSRGRGGPRCMTMPLSRLVIGQ